MDFLGDRTAEFKRGRGPDKKPRKRRSTQVLSASGAIAGGAATGYGASAVGREIETRRAVGRTIRQVRGEYRQKTGKYPSARKTRDLRRSLRETFKQHKAVGTKWKGADDVFNYEVVRPRSPFGFPKKPRIVDRSPVKTGGLRNTASKFLARPGGKAAAIGAGVGALGYGAYRGLRALDGRQP